MSLHKACMSNRHRGVFRNSICFGWFLAPVLVADQQLFRHGTEINKRKSLAPLMVADQQHFIGPKITKGKALIFSLAKRSGFFFEPVYR